MENRFHGLYAPSAGTIYPRLARMEADGLVTHTAVGGRKIYDITDEGRAELDRRAGELNDLESEIHASMADLAALAEEVEEGVRGSVRDLKRELRQARQAAQSSIRDDWRHWRGVWMAGERPASRAPGSPPFGSPASGSPPPGSPRSARLGPARRTMRCSRRPPSSALRWAA